MLLLASSVCGLFKWWQLEPEVILLAAGWYLRFSLSYRDVEELLAERGCMPMTSRCGDGFSGMRPNCSDAYRHLKPTSDSLRVDETRGCCRFAPIMFSVRYT